jgi:hypothetical protein
MSDVFEIAQILVSHAVRAHKDEIAIIAYYGSYAKGDASPTSDLDIFYIPDEGKARTLCSQFIIDDLPYDFWPVSWAMAEGIANADSKRPWAVSASLIADARVLYHRSQQDLERFNTLQARIAELKRPESRKVMVEKGLDAFKDVLFQLGQMRLAVTANDQAGTHLAGQDVVNSAVNCLALVNQTYFSKGWGANLSEILELPQRPSGLEGMIKAIILPQDSDSMLEAAGRLAQAVRGILFEAQTSLAAPEDAREVFKDFYFFIFEYMNKVLAACERMDVVKARFAAFQLQEEICQCMNKVKNGLYGADFNLFGEYSAAYVEAGFPDLLGPASQGDLVALARQVRRLDAHAREWLEDRSVELNVLGSKQELRRFLEHRDPLPHL